MAGFPIQGAYGMSAPRVMVRVVAAHARRLPSRSAPTPLAATRTRVRATRVPDWHYLPWLTSWRECVGSRRKDTTMTQHKDRKQAIRARMAATSEPYTVAARAISGRFAETGDEFLADRHADLDAGEFGGAMTDADYYDRISASDEPITYCAECGQATDDRCVFCYRRVCLDCSVGSKHQCPGLDG
jgi:hypothetical protein